MRLKPVLKLRCFNQHFFRKLVRDTTRQDNTDETRFDRDKRVFGDATNFFDLFIPDRLSPFFPWPASAPRSTGWPFLQQGQRNRLKKVRQMNDLEHFPHQVFSWMETCCACDAWDARDACDARDALNTRDACDARDANDPRDAKRCKD